MIVHQFYKTGGRQQTNQEATPTIHLGRYKTRANHQGVEQDTQTEKTFIDSKIEDPNLPKGETGRSSRTKWSH